MMKIGETKNSGRKVVSTSHPESEVFTAESHVRQRTTKVVAMICQNTAALKSMPLRYRNLVAQSRARMDTHSIGDGYSSAFQEGWPGHSRLWNLLFSPFLTGSAINPGSASPTTQKRTSGKQIIAAFERSAAYLRGLI
jgi:hypothetical protein